MKVSIIVTAYNYGRYVERCVRSCLNQNFPANQFEVIVVDDASDDDTLSIIEKYKRFPNFRVIANHENVGVAEAANIGICASLGQFVIRVDADDYVNANMVLFLSTYLEANHDAFGVACDYQLFDEHENIIGREYAEHDPISCGIMYRKDLLAQLGLYNPEFRHLEERELRERLGDYYNIHYLRIPFYRYRMHDSNKTKKLTEMAEYEARLEERQRKDVASRQ